MRDEQIVELYWQRSEDAISETAKKYEAYLSKIAYNVLSDIEDSRECVNDTYLKAWGSMPENRPSVLSTYLGRITRRLAIDVFRRHSSKKRYGSQYAMSLSEVEEAISGGGTPETALDAKEIDRAVNDFLRALPERQRSIFIGRYYFFDPLKTIASYCGMSEAGVKSSLFRIRQRLMDYLAKEGFEL